MTYNQPEVVRASFYATVEPVWRSWGTDDKDRPILGGAKVKGITQKKPSGRVAAGTIVTRLTLEFDSAAFLPLQPEAIIKIAADQLETVLVDADAPEPYDSGVGGEQVQ